MPLSSEPGMQMPPPALFDECCKLSYKGGDMKDGLTCGSKLCTNIVSFVFLYLAIIAGCAVQSPSVSLYSCDAVADVKYIGLYHETSADDKTHSRTCPDKHFGSGSPSQTFLKSNACKETQIFGGVGLALLAASSLILLVFSWMKKLHSTEVQVISMLLLVTAIMFFCLAGTVYYSIESGGYDMCNAETGPAIAVVAGFSLLCQIAMMQWSYTSCGYELLDGDN